MAKTAWGQKILLKQPIINQNKDLSKEYQTQCWWQLVCVFVNKKGQIYSSVIKTINTELV